jgi:hypothetical protein
LRGDEINLAFRRNFNIGEVLEWELEGVQLIDEEDTVRWMLTPMDSLQLLHYTGFVPSHG